MNVSQAMSERHSARAFTDQQVPENIIKEILQRASRAPSGAN